MASSLATTSAWTLATLSLGDAARSGEPSKSFGAMGGAIIKTLERSGDAETDQRARRIFGEVLVSNIGAETALSRDDATRLQLWNSSGIRNMLDGRVEAHGV